MISAELRANILSYVSLIVYCQLALVFSLAFFTVALLGFRKWRNARLANYDMMHGEQLVDELLALMESQASKEMVAPSRWSWIRLESMKKTLLNQILLVSGIEKEYLVHRYFELGLVKHDISLCASSLWWKRLSGISNMKVLACQRLAILFNTLKNDPHELVGAMAFSALSDLSHPLNKIDLEGIEKLISFGRQSYVFEISANWCRIHGFEAVFKSAIGSAKKDFRDVMLSCILNVKTPESSMMFVEFLQDAQYESPILLANIIGSLKEVGDPDSLDVIVDYVHHPEPRVQQRAIEYVLEFLPADRRKELRVLEKDPSLSVQRTLQEWNSRKVAS